MTNELRQHADALAEAAQIHAEQGCTGCQEALANYSAWLMDGDTENLNTASITGKETLP